MRPLAESVTRRQVFWLLVALVVVPTIVLAFYGITGVVDQRVASEQRLRERYLLQAGAIELGILARLAEEDSQIRRTLEPLDSDKVAPALMELQASDPLLQRAWVVGSSDIPPELSEAINVRVQDLSAQAPVAFLTVDEGRLPITLAVSRVRPERVVAYQLDPAALDALVVPQLVGQAFPNEQATYALRVGTVGISTPISFDRLREDLSTRLSEEQDLVERPMAAPFATWRISIAPTVLPSANWTRTAWVLLMVATVVLGVILLGRAIVQQQALSRLQTDFISNVSHELRTPLTSIRMFIETLQSGRVQEPEKVRECLDVIAAESERLSGKIERVLSWARMEAGRRSYEFEAVRPLEAVREVLAAFRAQQLSGGAPVSIEIPSDLPAIRIDRDAFGEALLNLLSNARKYGGAQVGIRIKARTERRFVAISVEDDGPGIPASELKRIFEKFYRPKILLSQSTQGSGLGLAIVRSVIEAHKGRVEVASEEQKGTCFTLYFPKT